MGYSVRKHNPLALDIDNAVSNDSCELWCHRRCRSQVRGGILDLFEASLLPPPPLSSFLRDFFFRYQQTMPPWTHHGDRV